MYASQNENLFYSSDLYLSQAVQCHAAFFTGSGNNITFPQAGILCKSAWEMVDRIRLNLAVCCSCVFP